MEAEIDIIISVCKGSFLAVKEIVKKTGLTQKQVNECLRRIRMSRQGYLASKSGPRGTGGYHYCTERTSEYEFAVNETKIGDIQKDIWF